VLSRVNLLRIALRVHKRARCENTCKNICKNICKNNKCCLTQTASGSDRWQSGPNFICLLAGGNPVGGRGEQQAADPTACYEPTLDAREILACATINGARANPDQIRRTSFSWRHWRSR
jgi:hypothetical protein